MTVDKLCSVFEFYLNWFQTKYGVYPANSTWSPTHQGHLAWMCQTAIHDLIPNGRIEKAMRWLGFVQGCLLCHGHFNLKDLKSHSRSEPDDNERLAFNTFKE